MGTAKCTRYSDDGTVTKSERDMVAHLNQNVEENGVSELNLNIQLTELGLMNGRAIANAKKPDKKGTLIAVLCSNNPSSATANAVVGARVKRADEPMKTRLKKGWANITGDGFNESCKWEARRTTTTAPEVPECPVQAAPMGFNMLPADGVCKEYTQEELHDLNKISVRPKDGVLSTQLVVRMKDRCVPVWGGLSETNTQPRTQWVMEKISLRTYGYQWHPDRPVDPDNPDDPNTVWSAPSALFYLDKASAPQTNDGTRFKMDLYNRLPLNPEEPGSCAPYENPNLEYPNCFHGDNSTNFHFHGFHVSPQPHQDFVEVHIEPKGTQPTGHATEAIGSYAYNVDPLRWTQAEGTHWYHAHKHGSTSLQVLNGLMGVFAVRGPFDRSLEQYREKYIVIQQLRKDLWVDAANRRFPRLRFTLVNGQANPIIKMKPGEIQRWRFTSATMQAAGQVKLRFRGLEARQIAMDGIPFAPENYARQPLLNDGAIDLDPANRADFLVQAPSETGRYYVTVEVIGALTGARRAEIQERDRQIVENLPDYPYEEPPLFTVDVSGTPEPMTFPSTLPNLPEYLADIAPPAKSRQVLYSMGSSPPATEFTIDGVKFDPNCANQTTLLDRPEQWRIENDSNVEHPFHIHTNPFQVIEDGPTRYSPPYVWQDTIALPAGTRANKGSVLIYQRYLDFTGGYVQHCHILGHEDRGMMLGVQTVCPNGMYGRATPDGTPECREGNYIPSLPDCEGVTTSNVSTILETFAWSGDRFMCRRPLPN